MSKLCYTDHAGQQLEVPIGPDQPKVTVGRMADCQIRVVDTSVSRRHSQITFQQVGSEFKYEVSDLGSSNGTFVNDQEVKRAQVNPGDALRFGNLQVQFIYEPPAGQAFPGPPPSSAPTAMGPGVGPGGSGFGGPSSPPPSGDTPYADPPSMAIAPSDIVGGIGGPPGLGPGPSGPPSLGPGPSGPPSLGPGPSGPPDLGSFRPSTDAGPPDFRPSQPPSGGPGFDGGDVQVPGHLGPEQLRSELSRALRRNNALAREVDELKNENQYLRSGSMGHVAADYDRMRRAGQELPRLNEELDQLREENEHLRKEDQRLRAQMDALSDRNVEVKEQFAALQGTQDDLRDKLREAREDLDGALFKRDELQGDVERLEKDKVELFDQLTKLKIEYNHVERSYEQLQKENGLLEFEYKRLDESNQELERELKSTLEGDNEQADDLVKLKKIVEEKDALVRELRDRLEDVKEELKLQESEDSSWIVEVDNLKKENEELNEEIEDLNDRIAEYQEELSAGKARNEGASEEREDELKSLREELERAQRRLKDSVASGVFASVQEENEELRLKIRGVTKELQDAKTATPSAAEELMTQIRELTDEKHRMEAKLQEQAQATETSPGDLPVLSMIPKEKARKVFDELNSMVSGWRTELETMQIHIGDLNELVAEFESTIEGEITKDSSKKIRTTMDELDPEWAIETMGETVKQILGDSKRIKSMLMELRRELKD